MKFTLDWLKEYVDIDGLSPSEIADHLTMLGLEVDAVTQLYPELASLKTAEVLSVEKHPNADKLSLCQVISGDNKLQIVCGAPNVRAGLKVVLAPVGTVMPDGMKIKKSKVRGVQSLGMLCSERELGLSDSHTGIMELPETTEHGQLLLDALQLADIQVEVDLTPNRPDCASVIGIAREVAGIIRKPLKRPVEQAELTTRGSDFAVDVESDELCPRYSARLIKNVTIGPSPWWLRKKLLSVGMRPINNVVDITNLVMMEYGQPLHAFDFANITGNQIHVRLPRQNELKFTTLDGVERKLENDMLMICDSEKPVAVAGVMGGMNSEVSETTTEILLESACFNPISIRSTGRRLNLSSEASYRFERGVDPGGVLLAMERAVSLLTTIANGTAVEGGWDIYMGVRPLNAMTLRISKTSDLIGMDLDYDKITDVLQSIGIRCKKKNDDTIYVNPPSFRVDIEREVDLIEEVARLIGYNNMPTTLPLVNLSYPEQQQDRLFNHDCKNILTSIGYFEAINYSFSARQHQEMMGVNEDDDRAKSVPLLNPLSEDQAVMRTMLIPGLLENVKRNKNFQQGSVKLFEIGKVFTPLGHNEQPTEKTRLAGVLCGSRDGSATPFHFTHQDVDILDAKGVVECLLDELRLWNDKKSRPVHMEAATADTAEIFSYPDQCILIKFGNQTVGSIGKITEQIRQNFSLKHDVYYFDLDFDALCSINSDKKSFTRLPAYPAVKRDLSLLVADHVTAGELLSGITSCKEKLLEYAEIFDEYHGDSIKKGFKSVAISVTYRSETKTLTEKNVEKIHGKIVKKVTDTFGATFREGK